LESTDFIFNNIESKNMGVYIVNLKSGMVESPFLPKSTISEKITKNNYKPYFQKITRAPLEFKITISPLAEKWTPTLKQNIGKWLSTDFYKEFQTYDDLNKYYYAICTDVSDLTTTDERGYIDLTFRTNSPYAYTERKSVITDLSTNTGTTNIIVDNKSNIGINYYPKIEMILEDTDTAFKIENLTNGSEQEFFGLYGGETISVDNHRKIIATDVVGAYRLSSDYFNGSWLELSEGENTLRITGKGYLEIETQYPIIG